MEYPMYSFAGNTCYRVGSFFNLGSKDIVVSTTGPDRTIGGCFTFGTDFHTESGSAYKMSPTFMSVGSGGVIFLGLPNGVTPTAEYSVEFDNAGRFRLYCVGSDNIVRQITDDNNFGTKVYEQSFTANKIYILRADPMATWGTIGVKETGFQNFTSSMSATSTHAGYVRQRVTSSLAYNFDPSSANYELRNIQYHGNLVPSTNQLAQAVVVDPVFEAAVELEVQRGVSEAIDEAISSLTAQANDLYVRT